MVYILSSYLACRQAEVTNISVFITWEVQSKNQNKRLDMPHLFKMHTTPPKDKSFDQLHNDVPIAQILYAEDHAQWTGNN
jgi:hypothetical protein